MKTVAQLVEEDARARGDEEAPRDYIIEIIERIERSGIDVSKYSSGVPSLRVINDLALFIVDKKHLRLKFCLKDTPPHR